MNEKRRQLFEAAIKCFAQKGYHATSIQEIVDEVGMTKGSLYFYFKSKEDLLLSSCQYYYDQMIEKMLSISKDHTLSPKEKLMEQLILHIGQLTEYRDFIMMLMNERAITINEDMRQFLFRMRAQTLYWNYTQIIDIYGENVRPYALDAATIMNAMLGEYFTYAILDNYKFDPIRLSSFLIDRLDDILNGMAHKGNQPILNETNMKPFIDQGRTELERSAVLALEEIQHLRGIVESLPLEPDRIEEAMSSLLVLETEIVKPDRQTVIAKGMIAYLRSLKRNELKPSLDLLEKQL